MENFLFYAAPAATGMAFFLFLVFHVLKISNPAINRFIMAAAGIIAACFSVFVYLYTASAVPMADVHVFRAGIPYLCGGIFMILLALLPQKQGTHVFMSAAAIIFLCTLPLFFPGIMVCTACFAAVDIFTILYGKTEIEPAENGRGRIIFEKILYLAGAALFLVLFILDNTNLRVQKFAFNGFISMLIMSSLQNFYTLTKTVPAKLKQPFIAQNNALILFTAVGQFMMIISMIKDNQSFMLPRFICIFMGFMLLSAAFKSITEEKFVSFAIRDIYLLSYLGLFAAVAAPMPTAYVVIYGGVMQLYAFFAAGFMAEKESTRATMSGIKYSFGKVPGGMNVVFSSLSALFVEIFIVLYLYRNVPSDQFVQTVIILCAALYSPVFLNRIFSLFSMVTRINIKTEKLFNKSSVFGALISGMVIAMLCRW
jgi:hypothetical protein